MNITGGQSSIYSGMTFGAYSEMKPGEGSAASQGGFFQLLKSTGNEQQEGAEEISESAAEVEKAKECIKNYQTVLVKEILYGNSNEQYWKEKRANKKYQLFKADNGAFGDETLEERAMPSEKKNVTWNSGESKKLSKDQLRYLKGKYNVADLSDEEYGDLLEELVDMQVISREEAEKMLAGQLPKDAIHSEERIMGTEAYTKKMALEKALRSERLMKLFDRLLEDEDNQDVFHDRNYPGKKELRAGSVEYL